MLARLKKPLLYLLAIVCYIGLTCAVLKYYKDDPDQMSWFIRETFNAKMIKRLDPATGISQDELVSQLGIPDLTAARKQNGIVYQLLYYRTHPYLSDGITTVEECTALLFKNRRLVSIGEQAIAEYQAESQAYQPIL